MLFNLCYNHVYLVVKGNLRTNLREEEEPLLSSLVSMYVDDILVLNPKCSNKLNYG